MIEHWGEFEFRYGGRSRQVYVHGSGPGVLLMHEIPGMTPELFRLADWVADAGFRVYMPHLFGEVGRPFSQGYALRSFFGVCLSREFAVLASGNSGRIADWLRALTRRVHDECGSRRVGVIGMCLTGHFALALMTEAPVSASVLSQPTLPLPLTPKLRQAVALSPFEMQCVRQRCQEGARTMGVRFKSDKHCPAERFDGLRRALGDAFEVIELDPADAPPARPNPHCALTLDLVDRDDAPTKKAALRVIAFLQAQLDPARLDQ